MKCVLHGTRRKSQENAGQASPVCSMLKGHGTVAGPKETRGDSSPPPERSCYHENHVHWHGACSLSLSSLNPLGAQSLPIFGDDGLASTGPCCTPATLTLPVFPVFTLRARYLSIMDCLGLLGSTDVNLTLSSPSSAGTPAPDLFNQTWTMSAISGGTAFTTIAVLANLKYARTWMEVDRLGHLRQVWRFIVNLRLNFDDMDATPFPRPPCDDLTGFPGFGGAWFIGFLDYASEPEGVANGRPEVNLALSHEPGCLSHEPLPAFNNQHIPATNTVARHEPYSYHLVAPSSGFTDATSVVALPATADIDLPSTQVESYRTLQTLITPLLTQEIGVRDVNVLTALRNCHCSPGVMGALALYWHQDVGAAHGASFKSWTECTSTSGTVLIEFASAVGVAGAPPRGFYQHFLGQWSLPSGTWPENRRVWTAGGLWNYSDSTCGYPPLQPDFHFIHGGSSRYPADDSSAVIHLYGDPMAVDYRLATDVANGLFLTPPPSPAQAPMVGIETWAISSWHFNR